MGIFMGLIGNFMGLIGNFMGLIRNFMGLIGIFMGIQWTLWDFLVDFVGILMGISTALQWDIQPLKISTPFFWCSVFPGFNHQSMDVAAG